MFEGDDEDLGLFDGEFGVDGDDGGGAVGGDVEDAAVDGGVGVAGGVDDPELVLGGLGVVGGDAVEEHVSG